MNNVIALNEWTVALIEQMSPSGRSKLMRSIAMELRKRNIERIRKQESADSQAWETRKNPKRGRKKMLQGFSKRKNLKISASTQNAMLGFRGKTGVIAKIHHHGLLDKVATDGPSIVYPERRLLDISEDDENDLMQLLLSQFGGLSHV